MTDFYTPEHLARQGEMFANRLLKRYRHLKKRFSRDQIDCFRLYDWDIPEIRAVADWYAGELVISEYERRQTGAEWLPVMGEAAARAFDLAAGQIHLKRRITGMGRPRYKRLAFEGVMREVKERDLSFYINLEDFLDTGLFSDHRNTRLLIRNFAKDSMFLNLFCYTGTFTCACIAGGARGGISVDRSASYLDWAEKNLLLNGLKCSGHKFVKSDTGSFLNRLKREGTRFSLAFVDPPSFYKDRITGESFDILSDHPNLLQRTVQCMEPGGIIIFSTNHQRFEPDFSDLPLAACDEITPGSIPEDYRNRRVHRCWKMQV